MARAAALLIAAAALSASPVLAAPRVTPIKPEAVLAAAKAICFDHLNDPEGQIAAAKAAPFNAEQAEIDDDGTVRLASDLLTVNILGDDSKSYCMVSGFSADTISSDKGAAIAIDLLGTPQELDANSAIWFGKTASGQPVMYGFMISRGEGYTLVSYASGTENN